MLWYMGLEGLGGLDLENDEDDRVRLHLLRISMFLSFQGFIGPVKFTGTSPELGDFKMRIVDGSELIKFDARII
jgi:mannosyl-oligosaccharide glucosidase